MECQPASGALVGGRGWLQAMLVWLLLMSWRLAARRRARGGWC